MVLAGNTLPQVSTGGIVTMNLHQVNADGAGPMKCSVDPTAVGDNFEVMLITTNVPGNNGRSNAANADFPLVAKMPAGVSCSGTVAGVKNVCMVKCQNPSGPFGGTVAVQTVGAGLSDLGTNSTGATGGAGSGTAGSTNRTDSGTATAATASERMPRLSTTGRERPRGMEIRNRDIGKGTRRETRIETRTRPGTLSGQDHYWFETVRNMAVGGEKGRAELKRTTEQIGRRSDNVPGKPPGLREGMRETPLKRENIYNPFDRSTFRHV